MEMSLSYSRISDFDRNGPRALNVRTEVSGEGIKIGSVTDDWLFDKEHFEDKYFIYDGEKPTATLGKLVDIILLNYNELPSKELVLRIIEINEFWKRSKEETLLTYFDIPEFWDYLRAQFLSKTKTLITSSELELGKELASILETHEFSKYIFDNNLTRINQYKFEITYKKCKFRGIIDMVLIDHENKTVQLIDLKTGQDNAENFMNSFIKYRYYFQEFLYMKSFDIICKDLGLEGYTVLPFQFLYIGRKQKLPLIYTVSEKWHYAAEFGFTTTSGYAYKGVNEVIDEIIWHLSNRVFDVSKSIFEGQGKLELDDQFINIV
jgi:hypothetical protein